MTVTTAGPWIWFIAFVLVLLALDLGVFHRKAHAVSPGEATFWTIVWVAVSLLFNAFLYVWKGEQPALEFLTGYLIEKALSVDNIFVFLLIFSYFRVPDHLQHRVLFWGILGAIVLRGLMIGIGAALIARFHWILYVFGIFLVWTGLKMMREEDEETDPSKNIAVRAFRRLVPSTAELHGTRFFVRVGGRLKATPLLMVLLVVETTDLAFAADSIPAIFAVTLDPFVVFTSNICAILGLRALYFLMAAIMPLFRFLRAGLSLVLVFIGAKILLKDHFEIPTVASLGVVFGTLLLAIVASVIIRPPEAEGPDEGDDETAGRPPEAERPDAQEEEHFEGPAGTGARER